MSSVNIFILVDALGWNYIKNRPFLDDIAVTKRPIKSILGFSSGVIPSILTGRYPQEHKHWSLYFYSPKTSPFRWTKGLLWLPKGILNSRISRKIIEEISKKIMGYSGYFETYLIPVEKLHLFDICENKNIYAPKGIRNAESVFDIFKKWKIGYRCWTYPLDDKNVFEKAKNSLSRNESSYYFLYLSESDAILHRSCHDKAQVNKMIDYYEEQIKDLYKIAQEKYKNVNLYVFSDHSMAQVNKSIDMKQEIESLGFKIPEDYTAFYDSTMARFWFYNSKAKDAIANMLNKKEYGRILKDSEIKSLGVKFENDMYGETIFLMNTGSIICPSFMGSKAPQGMHGYSIDDGIMDAILVSNKKVNEEIEDVKDFFKIMMQGHKSTGDKETRDKDTRNKRVKVLYFLNSVVRGGVEEHVLRLIEGLDREQFEPVLVCPQALIELVRPDLEKLNIRFYPICIRKWTSIREIASFINVLKIEKPDIVHSHLFFATMFAAPIAKLSGVKKVIETAHIREAWRKGIKKAYFIDRFFYRFTDKIIAVSNAVKKYLVAEKGINQEKIEVIHNGVDLSKFIPSNSQLNSKFKIGVIGRLEPQKGHAYFLDAVKMLDDKFHDTKFILAGEGCLKSDLEKKCMELDIQDRVEFLGFQKDIIGVFNGIDLLVLPSLYEGLPLVALEAGAMGKPVVVTDVDGSSEAVINNKTGYVVAPRDSLALKNAMEKFLNNRNVAFEFGINGRKNIEENFDIRKQTVQAENIYKGILL